MNSVAGAVRKVALTTWEGIWYVVMNIAFGAAYFGKIPAKRAMADFGLIEMTSAEHFWYVIQNICLGAGYFAKIPTAKALSELPQYRSQRQATLGTLSVDAIRPLPPPTPAGKTEAPTAVAEIDGPTTNAETQPPTNS